MNSATLLLTVSPGPCLSISELLKERREAPDSLLAWEVGTMLQNHTLSHKCTHGENYVMALPFAKLTAELET
ncbi:hypothetical protein K443DRAFT_673270 [Laccaria amethystina LaAM-08-1]|uniref:Uncharacterized protein n=1 Tax=Laccaria amethystina LaAM-08-1 TaxID=1095629 RepID=A0A0C9X670_9AGAR|nr:hypothetical protein K443DRAFT_673270 [Laccaria amethystina LaAM-08-1]